MRGYVGVYICVCGMVADMFFESKLEGVPLSRDGFDAQWNPSLATGSVTEKALAKTRIRRSIKAQALFGQLPAFLLSMMVSF